MKRKGFAVSGKDREKQRSDRSTILAEQEASEQVAVTILLSGGQEYTIAIDPTDGLLQDLYETLVLNDQQTKKHLFQIPIHNGQAVLAFPSDRLVGLITEPPIIIEQAAAQDDAVERSHDPLISQYVQIDDFLTPEEHQELLDYVFQRQPDFQGTTTFTGAANYRESVVLYSFPRFEELIRSRLRQIFPSIVQQFGIAPFQITDIEAQLTAHNDGQFYKVHNDNGSENTATRELTYVYYFYREPKPFTGGELVLYDSKIENNYYVQADTFKTVEPRNNSIVFFLSRYMHEVLPVHCPSRDFADSRFTINGWFRR